MPPKESSKAKKAGSHPGGATWLSATLTVLAGLLVLGAFLYLTIEDDMATRIREHVKVHGYISLLHPKLVADFMSSPRVATGSGVAGTNPHPLPEFDYLFQAYSGPLLTSDQVKKYDGSSGSGPIYLVVMGQVFDVQKGRDYYGKQGGYGGFSGRDGSRAFTTGEFNDDGLIPSLKELSPSQISGVFGWLDFYRNEPKYPFVGRMIGHYFDTDGLPTADHVTYMNAILVHKDAQNEDQLDAERFPPCNSRWEQGKGGEFWCSQDSGGIKRDWVGYVRHLRLPGKATRCACVSDADVDHPDARVLPECGKLESRCKNTLVDADGKAVDF